MATGSNRQGVRRSVQFRRIRRQPRPGTDFHIYHWSIATEVVVKLLECPQAFRRLHYEVLPGTDSEVIYQRSQLSHPWPAVHGPYR